MPASKEALEPPDTPAAAEPGALRRRRPHKRSWADLADETPPLVRLPVWPESLEAAAAAARADPAAAVAAILRQAAPEGTQPVASLRCLLATACMHGPPAGLPPGLLLCPASPLLLPPRALTGLWCCLLPSAAPPQRAGVGCGHPQGRLGRVDGDGGAAQVCGAGRAREAGEVGAGEALGEHWPASQSPAAAFAHALACRRAVLQLLLRVAAGRFQGEQGAELKRATQCPNAEVRCASLPCTAQSCPACLAAALLQSSAAALRWPPSSPLAFATPKLRCTWRACRAPAARCWRWPRRWTCGAARRWPRAGSTTCSTKTCCASGCAAQGQLLLVGRLRVVFSKRRRLHAAGVDCVEGCMQLPGCRCSLCAALAPPPAAGVPG